MSTIAHQCITLVCDECDERFETDGLTLHFRDLDEARSIAEDDEGWRFVGNQHICERCAHKPHAFTADAKPMELTCARCGLEEDDHDQVPAEAVAR